MTTSAVYTSTEDVESSREKVERLVIPVLPLRVAIVCCVLNFLVPGLGNDSDISGSIADLRTGKGWFDPWLSQFSFKGLMIVISTGFIPLLPLSDVSTIVMWESSQCLGKNIVHSTG